MVSTGGEVERFLVALAKAENVAIITPTTTILRRPSKNANDTMNQSQTQGAETPLVAKPPLHPPGNSDQQYSMMNKRKSSKK